MPVQKSGGNTPWISGPSQGQGGKTAEIAEAMRSYRRLLVVVQESWSNVDACANICR